MTMIIYNKEIIISTMPGKKKKKQNGGFSFGDLVKNATKAANVVQQVRTGKSKNPDWDYQPKPGENHQLFQGPDGLFYRARFSGPGTQVQAGQKDLYRKYGRSVRKAISPKNFASEVDRIAAKHDTDYLLAAGDYKKVQKADANMIKSLEKLQASGKEANPNVNIKAPLLAIKAKYNAEKVSGKLIDKFVGKEDFVDDKSKKLAERFQQRLAQEGFGPKRVAKEREYRLPDKKWHCPDCGSHIMRGSKSMHLKSKKHLASL